MEINLPRVVRRHSSISGWGVFAGGPINKNRRIVTYEGELIDNREADKRAWRYLRRARSGASGSTVVGFETPVAMAILRGFLITPPGQIATCRS
jgi:hypothetical protein